MDIINSAVPSGAGVQQFAGHAPAARTGDIEKTSGSEVSSGRVSEAKLKAAVGKINEVLQDNKADLKFSVDDATGMKVVQMIDSSTKEVLRQYPSKEVLNIARNLDKLQGLLVKGKA